MPTTLIIDKPASSATHKEQRSATPILSTVNLCYKNLLSGGPLTLHCEKLTAGERRSVTPMTPNIDRLSFSEQRSAMSTTLNTRPVKSNETRRDGCGRNPSLPLRVTSRTLRRHQHLKTSRMDQRSNHECGTLFTRAVGLVRFPRLLRPFSS